MPSRIQPPSAWPTSTPEAQGVDSRQLAQVVQTICDRKLPAHSLLIIRNGTLVLDAYFHPFAPGALHDVASCTKSVTATLIGIALEQGKIGSLEDRVLDWFRGRTIAHRDPAKEAMTIADLLTMRSGLRCIDRPFEVTLLEMMASPDWVQFMLDLPMASQPGTEFVYNSGGVHLLSALLTRATGQSAFHFAQEHLFGPLGIEEASWPYDGQRVHNQGWGNLRLKPHDMAKIGCLYLQNGMWQGRRILSPDWVAAATHRHVALKGDSGYGYLWWIAGQPVGLLEARGRGGQRIVVWPPKNAVLAITGSGLEPGVVAFPLLQAFRSDEALPENPEGVALLEQALERAASAPPSPESLPVVLPPVARAISGKTLVPLPNALNVTEMALLFEEPGEAVVRLAIAQRTGEAPYAEYHAGLDGVPRCFAGRYGVPGLATGAWTSDSTFEANLDEVGNINRFRLMLTFTDNAFTGTLEEATGLGRVSLAGVIRE